jgi:MFS family permease
LRQAAKRDKIARARTEDHWTDTADDAENDVRKPRSPFAEALRPLAIRPYRLMWLGSTTSSLGDAVVQIALVFAVLHIGGTATDIGLIAALQTVARVAFLLAGGVWADRLRRQYVMMAADVLRGGVEAVLAVLLLTGHAHVWEIAVGAVLYGIGASFFGPASTLVAAAIVLSVPCALVVLVPGIRGVHRTSSGEIVGPASEPSPALS